MTPMGRGLCENSSTRSVTLMSASQIALYSTIDTSGGVKQPPKTRGFRGFTQPQSEADMTTSSSITRTCDQCARQTRWKSSCVRLGRTQSKQEAHDYDLPGRLILKQSLDSSSR